MRNTPNARTAAHSAYSPATVRPKIKLKIVTIEIQPQLFGFQDRDGVTYSFRLFPLGGFVSFPEGIEEEASSFSFHFFGFFLGFFLEAIEEEAHKFSKVLYVVILHRKYDRALVFENLYQ